MQGHQSIQEDTSPGEAPPGQVEGGGNRWGLSGWWLALAGQEEGAAKTQTLWEGGKRS